MMIWFFAALGFIGFMIAVPFWKKNGGPVTSYVGVPLVVIGLPGLLGKVVL